MPTGDHQRKYQSPWDTIADPGDAGTISPIYSGNCILTSATTETRTLADPVFLGQRVLFTMASCAGTITITTSNDLGVTHSSGTPTKTIALAYDDSFAEVVAGYVQGELVWRQVA